jgi:hypothetical protein
VVWQLEFNIMHRTSVLLLASIGMLAMSAALNIAFMRQNTALTGRIKSLRSELQITMNVPLPELRGTDSSGLPLSLDVSGQGKAAPVARLKVLFVLSPECKFCATNWEHWQDLLTGRAKGAEWQPIFLNVGPLLDEGYIERHKMGACAIFQTVSSETLVNYRLYGTPQTIVIDRMGRARGAWKGVLAPKDMAEIRQLISDSTL